MTALTKNPWLIVVALPVFLAFAGCSPSDEHDPTRGFAGLATSTDNLGGAGPDGTPFLQPGPGDRIQLPRDLGPHPQHRIEWWYLTANLTTAEGEPLGLQWTQFRQALQARSPESPPPANWPLQSVWMADAAIAFQGTHRFQEKLARGDIGQAGAQADPFRVWLDDWQLTTGDSGRWQVHVEGPDWGYQLTLQPQRPPVRHGVNGFSAKSANGEGSMYFSYVDLAIEGTVTLGERRYQVTGTGWFDREWSSQFLRSGQQGWDWLGLHLDSGASIMAFRLREGDGEFYSGTWVGPDGKVVPLNRDDLSLTPVGHRATDRGKIPDQWQLRIPSRGVDVHILVAAGQHWNEGLFPYWESPVMVTGSETGNGYVELTGYGARAPE